MPVAHGDNAFVFFNSGPVTRQQCLSFELLERHHGRAPDQKTQCQYDNALHDSYLPVMLAMQADNSLVRV